MESSQRLSQSNGCEMSPGENIVPVNCKQSEISKVSEVHQESIPSNRAISGSRNSFETASQSSFQRVSDRVVSERHEDPLTQWIKHVRSSYKKGVPYEEIYKQKSIQSQADGWHSSKSSSGQEPGCKKFIMVDGRYEIVSPPLPAEAVKSYYTMKDDIMYQLCRVDAEITNTGVKIENLHKRLRQLEETANKPQGSSQQETEDVRLKSQCLFQQIYTENKRKAQESHGIFDKMCVKNKTPLYNQPKDTAVYYKNMKSHAVFKDTLVERLRQKHCWRAARKRIIAETYSNYMKEWVQKVEKEENCQKRKVKDGKNRELFEKIFPELRKQREDRERFNRFGARMRSDADLEEFMISLQEQEQISKKMSTCAVIPPIMLDPEQRKLRYVDNNGLMMDLWSEYETRKIMNVWTASEIEMFRDKYLQHPKDFAAIASYLEKKSVSDCIRFYYLTKKKENSNYKRLLRKSRHRARAGRGNQTRASAILSSPPADAPPETSNNCLENILPAVSCSATVTNSDSVTEKSNLTEKDVKQSPAELVPSVNSTLSTCSKTVTNGPAEGNQTVNEDHPAIGLTAITPINSVTENNVHTNPDSPSLLHTERISPETLTSSATLSPEMLKFSMPSYVTQALNSTNNIKYTDKTLEIQRHPLPFSYPYTAAHGFSAIPSATCSNTVSDLPLHQHRERNSGYIQTFPSAGYHDIKGNISEKDRGYIFDVSAQEMSKSCIPSNRHEFNQVPLNSCNSHMYANTRNSYMVHFQRELSQGSSTSYLNAFDGHIRDKHKTLNCEGYKGHRPSQINHIEKLNEQNSFIQRHIYENTDSSNMKDEYGRSERKRMCAATYYNSVEDVRQPHGSVSGLFSGITESPIIYRRV